MLFLNNLCRTCNTEDSTLVNIFKHRGNSTLPDLTYMLEYCTQTTLKDNSDYPQGICYNCIKQLEISYRFLKRFRLAQNEFDEAHGYMQETVDCSLQIGNEVASCEPERMQINLSFPKRKLPEFVDNVKCEETGREISDELQSVNPGLNKEIHNSDVPIACLRPKLETSSQAVICHICQKPFFTTKALNLHLKINHKQKTV